VSEFRQTNRKVYEIPFNSTNKYQLSIHEMHNGGDPRPYLLVMKGAPEQLFERCSGIYIDGTDIEMNDCKCVFTIIKYLYQIYTDWRSQFNRAYLELGNLGERVIGFCDFRLSENEYPNGYSFDVDQDNFPPENLRFLGLMAMIDPPRTAVPDALVSPYFSFYDLQSCLFVLL
jgi:sodium/potassium-transporting ATPase subunit alpha